MGSPSLYPPLILFCKWWRKNTSVFDDLVDKQPTSKHTELVLQLLQGEDISGVKNWLKPEEPQNISLATLGPSIMQHILPMDDFQSRENIDNYLPPLFRPTTPVPSQEAPQSQAELLDKIEVKTSLFYSRFLNFLSGLGCAKAFILKF